MIPKPQDSIAVRFQVFYSLVIILCLLEMLTAIQLDDQFRFRRAKVGDVLANGMLPTEGDSQLIVSYPRPEFLFSRCRFFVEADGSASGLRSASQFARHTRPLLASPICAPRIT